MHVDRIDDVPPELEDEAEQMLASVLGPQRELFPNQINTRRKDLVSP